MSKIELFLLFLLICLLPSQLSYHVWIDGFNIVRSDYLSLTIYFTDLIAFSLLLLRISTHTLTVNRKIKHLFHSKWSYVFLVILVLNIVISLSPALTIYKYLQVALYLALFSEYPWNTTKYQKILLFSLLTSVFWTAVLSISQFLLNSSLGGALYWLGERPLILGAPSVSSIFLGPFGTHIRSYSTFPHPNALAGFLVVSLFMFFGYKKMFLPNKLLTIFNIVIVLATISLLTTFSLSSVSLFIITLIFVYFPNTVSLKLKVILSLIIVIATLIASYNIRPISVLDRLNQLHTSLITVLKYPIFGTGFGSYVLGSVSPISQFGSFYQPVHNIYLLLLSELGFIGIGVVSIFLSKMLKFSILLTRQPAFVPITMIFVLGLIDHYWLTSHSNQIFAVLLLVFIFKQK